MPFFSPRTDWNLHISSPEAPAGAYTLKYSAPSSLPIVHSIFELDAETIHPCMLYPRTFNPCAIRPRILYPSIFTSP
jgi:hypothetical protein